MLKKGVLYIMENLVDCIIGNPNSPDRDLKNHLILDGTQELKNS